MKTTIYPDNSFYQDQKTPTLYNLQEVQQDGKKPTYIISESDRNQGRGFDSGQTRDGVANDVANAVREAKGYQRGEAVFYQQRPDGDFDLVGFREIGRNGRSEADVERAAAEPGWKGQAASPESQDWGEYQRTKYTRAEVEKAVGAPLDAAAETPQQRQESLNQQYKDLSGPQINRAAEVAADTSRRQEQNQQMDQQQKQQSHGLDL